MQDFRAGNQSRGSQTEVPSESSYSGVEIQPKMMYADRESTLARSGSLVQHDMSHLAFARSLLTTRESDQQSPVLSDSFSRSIPFVESESHK